ncbi:hypothetical protein, partial [Neisseria gonorrhoeae]|uniref:hypothetical protein n=1 Tax=Neisseria gonorrhoeae TaxID=485 RepID=UPI001C569A50
TGTALPRLAVLFLLSAASPPCPDLNLIHYRFPRLAEHGLKINLTVIRRWSRHKVAEKGV